jgi:hypothetical protein
LGENIPVAGVDGVTIHCPSEGRYAFYNSPYPAHRLSTGIDIYPGRGFGEAAGSPVSGRVILVRKVRAPKSRRFRDHGHDTVILLESRENPERVIKILHVEPSIQEGDVLETGQTLGTLIRSGYFGYSTAPHIHLEVRSPGDPLRARGGLRFERLQEIGNVPELGSLEGLVHRSVAEYAEIEIRGASRWGLQCEAGGAPGVLDGGIPYYGWLGVHTDATPHREGSVNLCGKEIADISETGPQGCVATCRDFSLTVGKERVGLSTCLYPRGEPRFFLIPLSHGGLSLEPGARFSIEIR